MGDWRRHVARSTIIPMMGLRLLAAVFCCLAVLAGGLTTVAAAVPAAAPPPMQSTVGAPCTHCDDCDSQPCPMAASTCLQVSSSATPTLATAMLDPPAIGFGKIRWPLRSIILSGLSPPPDPLPPRA